jgi:hypothetical protein
VSYGAGISLSVSKESVNIVGEKASNLEERTSVDRRHTGKTEEKNSDLQKQNVALVAPVDPSYPNTSIGGNHEDKLTTHMESPGSNKLFYYAKYFYIYNFFS